MADVTEVIHRITYEVNNDALITTQKIISSQLAEITRLSQELTGLQRSMLRLSEYEAVAINRIAGQVDKITRQLVKEVAKTEGILSQAVSGIFKGLDVPQNVSDLFSKLSGDLFEIVSPADGAGKALNNVGKGLKVSTASMPLFLKSVSAIAGRLMSFSNILGIALTVINLFKDGTGEAKDESEDLADAIDEVAERSRKLGTETGNEMAKMLVLKAVVEDATLSYKKRQDAIGELRKLYPSYLKNLTDEQIMAGKVADAYQKISANLLNAAMARVFTKQLEESLSKYVELTDKIQNIADSEGIPITVTYDASGLKVVDFEKSVQEDIKKDIRNSIKKGSTDNPNPYPANVPRQPTSQEKLNLPGNALTAILHQAKSEYSTSRSILDMLANIHEKMQEGPGVPSVGGSGITSGEVKMTTQQRVQEEPMYLEKRPMQKLPVGDIEASDMKAVDLPGVEIEQKGLTEAQKENIKEGIDGYKKLAQAAAEAYDTIIQAQIDALDKEISLREKRVEEAKKLAERGNVEALRIEEDRLRKAQEQRARFARQQQTVNAAITVSNAIAAVARAALEGGGFGSAATIAALIAALAAGYAAVSSMTQDTESFATGVVDYKGKGGPRDDKNWVRISSGESIITAAGTQKNRALLEAINQGAALHMINPSLPLMMPAFKQPGVTTQAYANTKDLKQLENKLDEVVGAIEDNKLRQNIFFNEQGVGIMTERAMKKERKRWM